MVKASEWKKHWNDGMRLRSEMSSGWQVAPGRLDVVEASGWTLRVVNILEELP